MTKREKIKEVYYKYFDKSTVDDYMHISINGYISIDSLRLIKQVGFLENFESGTHRTRPIELKGIENNNGWIKIESENDLPKENGWYLVVDSETNEIIEREFYGIKHPYFFNHSSHYQPILRPQKPIY